MILPINVIGRINPVQMSQCEWPRGPTFLISILCQFSSGYSLFFSTSALAPSIVVVQDAVMFLEDIILLISHDFKYIDYEMHLAKY